MDNSIYLGSMVVNSWGQMPPGDYDMSRMTLFTGETGAGKSTMLDALQAVMTAAHSSIMNFNPGQDEAQLGPKRGKTRRSVESYAVGAEYSKFSRPQGAQCYVGAVFVPGEGCLVKPFTALMAVSAVVEGSGESRQAKLESMSFYILDGAQLSYSDLMVDPEQGISIPVSQIGAHLKRKFPNVIDFGNRKTDYLSVLYGRFRGRPGPIAPEEAKDAAKAWVQSIAYRPIGNVHDLVRDEILQHDAASQQEHVERVSSLMRQVAQLRKEGEYLAASVGRLNSLKKSLAAVRELQTSSTESLYMAMMAGTANDSRRGAELQEKIECTQAKIEELQRANETLAVTKAELENQRTMVEARLLGVEGQQQKKSLEDRIATASMAIAKGLRDISQALRGASLLESRAKAVLAEADGLPRAFKGLEDTLAAVEQAYNQTAKCDAGSLLREVESLMKAKDIDTEGLRDISAQLKSMDWAPFSKLYAVLVSGDSCLLTTTIVQETLLGSQELEATRAITDLMRQQSTLASGKVTYPRGVEQGLQRIREQFPNANAQVLCDLIDPRNREWQAAIEGYMAGARFSVLVEPTWERMVMDYVRQQNLDVRVVQGSLCLERRRRMAVLPQESIVHELVTDNELAEAYLWDQFGTVEKVHSTEALRQTSRGVMLDGKAAGSRTMYALNNRTELVFGKAARAHQADALNDKLAAAQRDIDNHAGLKAAFTKLKFALDGLKLPVLELPDFEPLLIEVASAKGALSALDLSATASLSQESSRLKQEIASVEKLIAENLQKVSRAGMDIESCQKQLKSLDERAHSLRESARAVAGKLIETSKLTPEYGAMERLKTLQEQSSNMGSEVDALHAKHSEQAKQVLVEISKARETLSDFNAYVRADERFMDALPFHTNDGSFELGFKDAVRLETQVEERIATLSGIGLLNNSQQLKKAGDSFSDAFTKTFCADIKNRVEDGMRTLKQLNKTLERMVFGGDRYTLDASRWVPEMQEIYEFLTAVSELALNQEDVDLFNVSSMSERHLEIRDKLIGLLLDENQEQATKQLMRIADYRNYRQYDIFVDSVHGGRLRISQWGTASGGQSETPSYAVRAAVLANHMKIFDKGPSLKLMVSDESFAKMDESRARGILRYLSQGMGLQVVCAMPTTKAGALQDEFDRQYSFTRMGVTGNGELDFMTDVDERVFEKENMHAAWDAQREHAQEKAKVLFEQTNPAPLSATEEAPQAA